MKIAILSDTHDNLPNLQKACAWLNEQKISEMIHCGDLASKETIAELSKIYEGKVNMVFGNMDRDYVTQEEVEAMGLNNICVQGDVGEVKLDNSWFAFNHYPDKARELALSKKYRAVFYGHLHKPWSENVGDCLLANPGNLAGIFYRPTFAVYDSASGKLELKLLERL